MGVELSAPFAVVGPFDGGDAGLGEALAEVLFESLGGGFLRPAAEFTGETKVEGDDLVEIDAIGVGLRGWLVELGGPLASGHLRHPTSRWDSEVSSPEHCGGV